MYSMPISGRRTVKYDSRIQSCKAPISNDTNIQGDSDVDVVLQITSLFDLDTEPAGPLFRPAGDLVRTTKTPMWELE